MATAMASIPASAIVATTTATRRGSGAAKSQGASAEWAKPESASASSGQPKATTPIALIRARAVTERGPRRTARAWGVTVPPAPGRRSATAVGARILVRYAGNQLAHQGAARARCGPGVRVTARRAAHGYGSVPDSHRLPPPYGHDDDPHTLPAGHRPEEGRARSRGRRRPPEPTRMRQQPRVAPGRWRAHDGGRRASAPQA